MNGWENIRRGDKVIWINNGYSVGKWYMDINETSVIKINDVPYVVDKKQLIPYNEENVKELEKQFKPTFENGDKVKYSYGLTFTYIGLDPFDNNYGYFVHSISGNTYQERMVDRLPMNKITHVIE